MDVVYQNSITFLGAFIRTSDWFPVLVAVIVVIFLWASFLLALATILDKLKSGAWCKLGNLYDRLFNDAPQPLEVPTIHEQQIHWYDSSDEPVEDSDDDDHLNICAHTYPRERKYTAPIDIRITHQRATYLHGVFTGTITIISGDVIINTSEIDVHVDETLNVRATKKNTAITGKGRGSITATYGNLYIFGVFEGVLKFEKRGKLTLNGVERTYANQEIEF